MVGHLTIAWMWLRQAITAQEMLSVKSGNLDHLEGKYWACRYFFNYVLPQASWMRELLGEFDDTTIKIPVTAF